MPTTEPRFGIWAPVCGNWGALNPPSDPFDSSFARSKALVVEAERLGFASTLIAQHTINPYGQEHDQLDAWTAAAALAAVTDRIEIITAIKPYLYHPVVLAKMALGIEDISGGRFAVNVVNAWFVPELEKSGIGFAGHDDRYRYGTEWLRIVRALLAGERVNHAGERFTIRDYDLRPASRTRSRPRIYVGGESPPARDLVAELADTWFINGQPLPVVRELIADVARRPRTGESIRFGMSAFVIARASDAEAEADLEEAFRLQNQDDISEMMANVDRNAVMFHTFAKYPHVGTNGGSAAGLVGSYDTVAARIRDFHDIGIELFMLQFQPFAREQARFAHEVMPRVRRLVKQAA